MREHLQSEPDRALIREEVRDALVAFFRLGHGCGRLSGKRKQWLTVTRIPKERKEDVAMVFHENQEAVPVPGEGGHIQRDLCSWPALCSRPERHRVRRGTRCLPVVEHVY